NPSLPTNVQVAAPDVAWRMVHLPNGGFRVLFQAASTAPIDVATPPGVSSYGGNFQNDHVSAGRRVTAAGATTDGQPSTLLQGNPVVDMSVTAEDGSFETVSITGLVENGNETFSIPADDGSTSGAPDQFVALSRVGAQLIVQRLGAIPALVVLNA